MNSGRFKRNKKSNGLYRNNLDTDNEIADILKQQQQHHLQMRTTLGGKKDSKSYNDFTTFDVLIYLENKTIIKGEVRLSSKPKCKLTMKDKSGHSLFVDLDYFTHKMGSPDTIADPQNVTALNEYLANLHKEAILEFPSWLEKYSSRAEERNPFFNLDEIREEYKYKKLRFGLWRIAMQIGFFDYSMPSNANFIKVTEIMLANNEGSATNLS